MPSSRDADVIVVGAGNAGFCAALAAAERGARVLMLEKAPDDWLGGNSYFTAGAIRSVHAGLEDVLSLVEPIDRARVEATDLEPYGADDFREDMRRLTEGRADPELAELLIGDSRKTLGWLADQGIPLRLMYDRQSYAVDGRHVFWGGLHVGTVDGGRGLIEHERRAAANAGVELRTGHAVTGLIQHGDAVKGVRCRRGLGRARARDHRAGGRDRRRRVRGRSSAPRDVPGAELGRGQGARHPSQHRRGARGDARRRCASVRTLERLSQHRLGRRRAAHRRPRADEPALAPVVSARPRRQPRRRALRGRGSRLPQLHLRALRRRDPESAGLGRLPAVRRPDRAAAAQGRVRMHPASPARRRRRSESSRTRSGSIAPGSSARSADFNAARHRRPVRPRGQGRQAHARTSRRRSRTGHCRSASRPTSASRSPAGSPSPSAACAWMTGRACWHRSGQPIPGLHAAGELVGGLFFHNYPGGTGLMSGAVFGRRAGASAAALAARGGAAARTPRQRDSHLSIERSKEESRQ